MAAKERSTAILDVRPMLRGSEKAVVEAVLGRRPGVERVEPTPSPRPLRWSTTRPRPTSTQRSPASSARRIPVVTTSSQRAYR
jgi:hypothetical protein